MKINRLNFSTLLYLGVVLLYFELIFRLQILELWFIIWVKISHCYVYNAVLLFKWLAIIQKPFVRDISLLWFNCDVTILSHFRQVIEIMAAVREEDVEELANVVYSNTVKLFFGNQNLEATIWENRTWLDNFVIVNIYDQIYWCNSLGNSCILRF